jgi:hypothetical protein
MEEYLSESKEIAYEALLQNADDIALYSGEIINNTVSGQTIGLTALAGASYLAYKRNIASDTDNSKSLEETANEELEE